MWTVFNDHMLKSIENVDIESSTKPEDSGMKLKDHDEIFNGQHLLWVTYSK